MSRLVDKTAALASERTHHLNIVIVIVMHSVHRSSFFRKNVCTAVRLWCVLYITYIIFNTFAVTFS